MAHDFKAFPELTNSQMADYYFQSPHRQINEDFRAEVVKVTDGDTITVRWSERDFDFPIRFAGTNAPELNERLGHDSKAWLEGLLLGQMVDIRIDKNNRVGKFGRIIGTVIHHGMSLNQISVIQGRATPFDQQDEGDIPPITEWLD